MNLINRLLQNQDLKNMKEVGVVIDSQFLVASGNNIGFSTQLGFSLSARKRMVYISVNNNKLEIFTKDSKTKMKHFFGDESWDMLNTFMTKSDIYGINTGLDMSHCDISIEVNTNLGLVFIESALYHIIKSLVKLNEQKTIKIQEKILPVESLNALVSAFKQQALLNYPSVVYSPIFLSKIKKSSKFYNIQKSFVPVCITSKYVYNPLLDDASLSFRSYDIFTKSQERVVEVLPDDALTTSFLTHAEICQALHMKNFMRFRADLLYRIIVGLLMPNHIMFPNKVLEVYRTENQSQFNLKYEYTQAAYSSLVANLQAELAQTDPSSDAYYVITEKLAELGEYRLQNTLLAFCNRFQNVLTSIGPTSLDSKADCTALKLYAYLTEAKL